MWDGLRDVANAATVSSSTQTVASNGITRAEPIYVVGDSHVLLYADRIAPLPANPAALIVFHALYAPGLKAAAFADERGELSEQVRSALVAARLLVSSGDALEAYHRTMDPHWLAVEGAEDRPRVDPPIVLSTGGLDALDLIGGLPVDDFALPSRFRDPNSSRFSVTAKDAAAYDDVAAFFAPTFTSLDLGLRRLRAYGFERLAILSIAPPTANDTAFSLVVRHGGRFYPEPRCRTPFRYKVTMVVNGLMREAAAANGVTFIDRWEAQTVNGLIRPGLLNDNIHLNSQAWQDTAAAVIATLAPV